VTVIDDALDLESRAQHGIRIARRVGRAASALRESMGQGGLAVENKGLQDFVTIADQQAEQSIRRALNRHFPEDGFVGEETGGTAKGNFWVVDPIDGTTNFIRGFRHWGVSMAFVAGGRVEIGIVYDAALDKVYWAVRGRGAFKERKPIRAATAKDPTRAIAILGHSRRTSFEDYLEISRRLHELGVDYRRMGAAAIGLVRVADGIADLYYERHLNAWDMLAGALIAHEAGADVAMAPLAEGLTVGGPVIAGNRGLAEEFAFLRKTLPELVPL
jgi:myo-inositol-1(or 4)-monophosphatase